MFVAAPTVAYFERHPMSQELKQAALAALEAIEAMTKGNTRDSDNNWGRVHMPKNAALNQAEDAAAALRAALARTQQAEQVVPDVRRIALSIVEDLDGREGILDGVDDDVKQEMLDTFANIIDAAMLAASGAKGE